MAAEIATTLGEIETLLAQEREALRSLDSATIEAIAKRKLEFADALKSVVNAPHLDSNDKDRLKRIRDLAAANQVLLVHARSCVRGALEAVTGQPMNGYPAPTRAAASAAPSAFRFNMRG